MVVDIRRSAAGTSTVDKAENGVIFGENAVESTACNLHQWNSAFDRTAFDGHGESVTTRATLMATGLQGTF